MMRCRARSKLGARRTGGGKGTCVVFFPRRYRPILSTGTTMSHARNETMFRNGGFARGRRFQRFGRSVPEKGRVHGTFKRLYRTVDSHATHLPSSPSPPREFQSVTA